MSALEQFFLEPSSVGVLLGAGAVGAILGFIIALIALKRQESGRVARLEEQLTVSHKRREELQDSLDVRKQEHDDLQKNLNEANILTTRLEEQKDAVQERLDAANKELELRQGKLDTRESERDGLRDQLEEARTEITRLSDTLEHEKEKLKFLDQAKEQLGDTFKSLAGDALRDNRESLTGDLKRSQESAKEDLQHRQHAIQEIVNPITQKLHELENANVSMRASVSTSLDNLARISSGLKDETRELVNALRRSPNERGRWGELQLQRCVELAGMDEHVLWEKQVSVGNGSRRPDLVVTLPNNRQIIVDAKTPIKEFLSAIDAKDDASRDDHLRNHAKLVRNSMEELSSKQYWESFPDSPDFVVMFIPGEAFYSAALQSDRSLLETSVDRRVIIASPTNLIALLLTIQLGWREVELTREAEEIGILGRELYKRANTLMSAIAEIRRGLDSNVKAYNKAVGSLNNYIPQVKRLGEFRSIDGEKLPETELFDNELRTPRNQILPEYND